MVSRFWVLCDIHVGLLKVLVWHPHWVPEGSKAPRQGSGLATSSGSGSRVSSRSVQVPRQGSSLADGFPHSFECQACAQHILIFGKVEKDFSMVFIFGFASPDACGD